MGKKGTNTGNTNRMKFKTHEQRRDLSEKYATHIRNGYSDESFLECDPQTLKRYMEEFPSDFDTDMIERAQRERMFFWEKAGVEGTLGKLPGFNAKCWIFNMQNRFPKHWNLKGIVPCKTASAANEALSPEEEADLEAALAELEIE